MELEQVSNIEGCPQVEATTSILNLEDVFTNLQTHYKGTALHATDTII